MATLIIINGAPGVGKTTLSGRLSKELGIPGIGKDDIKEFLFDSLEPHGREDSGLLGRASVEALYAIADQFLASDKTIMIDNAFWPELAAPIISDITQKHHSNIIEVYCHTDESTRMQRFNERQDKTERHPVHSYSVVAQKYGPLNRKNALPYDTTGPQETNYHELVTAIKSRLQ